MKTKIITILMAFMVGATVYGREISGKVVGENDTPLDYVNVVLYRDSTYIAGTVTDQAGMFSIYTDATGNLITKCSFVGYETSRLQFRLRAIWGQSNLRLLRWNSEKWWSAPRDPQQR